MKKIFLSILLSFVGILVFGIPTAKASELRMVDDYLLPKENIIVQYPGYPALTSGFPYSLAIEDNYIGVFAPAPAGSKSLESAILFNAPVDVVVSFHFSKDSSSAAGHMDCSGPYMFQVSDYVWEYRRNNILPQSWPAVFSFYADFVKDSVGSGPNQLLLESVSVFYEYEDISVFDVGNHYDLLPQIDGFVSVHNPVCYDENSNSYHLFIQASNQIYSFDVSFPSGFVVEDFLLSQQDFPYTTHDLSMSYGFVGGHRVLFCQPDFGRDDLPSIEDPFLFSGFTLINLDDSTWQTVEKVELMGVINKEANDVAYLYCFFPFYVQNLLSISLRYNWRYAYMDRLTNPDRVLSVSSWQTVEKSILSTDHSLIDSGGLGDRLLYSLLHQFEDDFGSIFENQDPSAPDIPFGSYGISYVDSIQSINPSSIPNSVMDLYFSLDPDPSSFSSLNFYKVYLQQATYPRIIPDGLPNYYDYQIEDLVILSILYEFNGVLYEAPTELIDSVVIGTPDFPDLPGPTVWISSFLLRVMTWVLIISFLAVVCIFILRLVFRNVLQSRKYRR